MIRITKLLKTSVLGSFLVMESVVSAVLLLLKLLVIYRLKA